MVEFVNFCVVPEEAEQFHSKDAEDDEESQHDQGDVKGIGEDLG